MRSDNCCYLYLSAHGPVARIAEQCLRSQAAGTEQEGAQVNTPSMEMRHSPPAQHHGAVLSAQLRSATHPEPCASFQVHFSV